MDQFKKYDNKKQHRRLLIVSLRKQHRLFVREGFDDTEDDESKEMGDFEKDTSYENWKDLSDITGHFIFGVYLPIQVKATEEVMVFKNGVRLPGFLGPGRHILFNMDPFFTRYHIYRFNTQNVTLKALVDGRVHDSQLGLDLKVVAEFHILCRLKYRERFLIGVDRPLRLFYTIFNDIVNEEMATLEHDLLGKWARDLRDRILQRLQVPGSETERQIGIEVLNVFVDNVSNNEQYIALQDQNLAFKAEMWRNTAQAIAEREQARILEMNPSLIKFQGSDMGRAALEGEVELSKMMLGLGMMPPPQSHMPSATNQLPESAGFNPAAQQMFAPHPAPPLITPPALPTQPAGPATPPVQPVEPFSGGRGNQQSGALNSAVSEERKEQERAALAQAGFVLEGGIGPSGVLDAKCWSISVTTHLPNNDLLTISFRCEGYPYRPPNVSIFSKGYGGQTLQQLQSQLNWNGSMMLVNIAQEIRHNASRGYEGGSR